MKFYDTKNRLLYILQNSGSADIFEIYNILKPYISLHQISFENNYLIIKSKLTELIPIEDFNHEQNNLSISYTDIITINQSDEYIQILVKKGFVYNLLRNEATGIVYDMVKIAPEESRLSFCRWRIHHEFKLLFSKLSGAFHIMFSYSPESNGQLEKHIDKKAAINPLLICQTLKPYINLHKISFKEKYIRLSNDIKIFYSDIINITHEKGSIFIFLRTAYIYRLSDETNIMSIDLPVYQKSIMQKFIWYICDKRIILNRYLNKIKP